ncbi:glycosyltransferase family 2 protein [Labilibacter marinus]|uniref:glycosyltransferase family 2 protein n=1 Tax=Labilibacter marinus TaxID=1477105 RepID=UPI00082D3BF8|nr:glycosyltransferase [Labilibacter marinus]
MLSICIPVYNYDVTTLVGKLCAQLKDISQKAEIIVMDDGSSNDYKLINKTIKNDYKVNYIELKENVGRSAIRNLLAKRSIFNYILFLDCDSDIKPNFVKTYMNNIDKGSEVICGGTLHPNICPSPNKTLRWKSGTMREDRSVSVRERNKYTSFTSNNFVVKTEVFYQYSFNENITKYGHEDTLFGIELDINSVKIKHIDNPAIHIGIDSNIEYLNKTEQAIENLVQILLDNKYSNALYDKIKLLRYAKMIQQYGLKGIVIKLYLKFRLKIINNLCSNNPNLLLFDLYKIGYYFNIKDKK